MMSDAENDTKPWYRQFWAWFLLSPLIVVWIVSSITVTLAVKGADDRVIDNYYKEGRLINMRQDEDLLAQQLGVKAELNFDLDLDEMSLRLEKNKAILPEILMLEFSHPSKEKYDHVVKLNRVGANQYQAEIMGERLQYRWYLRLMPEYTLASGVENKTTVIDANQVNINASDSDRDSDLDSSDTQNLAWRLRGEIDFTQTTTVTLQPSEASDGA